MGVKFAGYDCEIPEQLLLSCQQATPPLPTHPWLGNANRFLSPIGLRPGYGWVLLQRAYLNKLTSAVKGYDLVFTATPANALSQSRTLKNIRMVGTPIAVSPGGDSSQDTYLVELADRRVDCVGLCGKRYNWRIHPDCPYESESLNSGSAWTWTTLLTDLWDAVGCLGTFPTLPSTPVGVPEQIDGMGCRAADLLEDLLLLNGMGVEYDNFSDEFSIVSFSAESTSVFGKRLADLTMMATGAQLATIEDEVIWDQKPLVDVSYKLPAYVRVVFPVWSPGGAPIDTATYYVVDVADTTPDSSRIPSSYVLVQDFVPLRTNQIGTALNGSDLVTRAAAVAANFYKVARRGAYYPLSKTYTGIIEKSLIRPGANLDVLCYEDIGYGPKTHIIQTGRLGFGPIFYPDVAAQTSGALVTGNPFGTAASSFYRYPIGSTSDANPIYRAANIPPGELRQYNQGPLATGRTAITMAGGSGQSSIMERVGPLRQWDSAVEARSVDGYGQRLWLAKTRPQHLCFVKVTSLTRSGIYYPAIEQFIAPITGTITAGDVCWFYDPNTTITPVLNSIHICYLDGTDGAGTPVKVYIAGPGGVGSYWTLAGRTGSSTISAGDTATLNNGTVSGDAWTPDVASASLAGIVSLSDQRLGAGTKSVLGGDGFKLEDINSNNFDIAYFDTNPVTYPGNTGPRIRAEWSSYFLQTSYSQNSGGRFYLHSNLGLAADSYPAYCLSHNYLGVDYELQGGTATTGGLTFVGGLYISGSISVSAGSVSGFDEAAQDAVGTILTDTATVNLTYVDATPSITADVIYQMSVTSDPSGLKLSGDESSPADGKFYGVSAGIKGWYTPSGGGDIQTLLDGIGSTLGDTLARGAADWEVVAGNITTTKKFWTQTGNGAMSALPGWNTIVVGDLPSLNGFTDATPADADRFPFYDDSAGANRDCSGAELIAYVTAGVAVLPVVDTTAIVKGSADATKKIRFEVDGLTTGTTRVLTVTDADYTLAGIDVVQTFSAAQKFNTNCFILRDSTNANSVTVKIDETETANRTLNVLIADADRTLTINGNATLPAGTMVPNSVTLTAAGLVAGGGDLSANRTFTVTAASQSDQETGTSTSVAVVPGVQKYHPSAAKAWVKVTGAGTPSIAASYNVSSITDLGVGYFRVNLTTSFSSANYAAGASAGHSGSICDAYIVANASMLAGSFEVGTYAGGGLADCDIWCAWAFGDQ